MRQFWAGTTYQVGVQTVPSLSQKLKKPDSRAMLNSQLTCTQASHLAGGFNLLSLLFVVGQWFHI